MNTWSPLVGIATILALCFASAAPAIAASDGAVEQVAWVPGHWAGDTGNQHWVSGYYTTAQSRPVAYAPPRVVWVEGRWRQYQDGWRFEEGHYVQESALNVGPPASPPPVVVYQQPPTVVYQPAPVYYEEPSPRVSVDVGVGFYASPRYESPRYAHPAYIPVPLPPLPRFHGHIPLPHELILDLFGHHR